MIQVGKAMSSNESAAYEIMRSLDVDYVLIIFGGVIGYSGDDINKFLWMVRIAEGEHPKDIRVSGTSTFLFFLNPFYFCYHLCGSGHYCGGKSLLLNCHFIWNVCWGCFSRLVGVQWPVAQFLSMFLILKGQKHQKRFTFLHDTKNRIFFCNSCLYVSVCIITCLKKVGTFTLIKQHYKFLQTL